MFFDIGFKYIYKDLGREAEQWAGTDSLTQGAGNPHDGYNNGLNSTDPNPSDPPSVGPSILEDGCVGVSFEPGGTGTHSLSVFGNCRNRNYPVENKTNRHPR